MAFIRDASLEDAERILEIYDYYVRETAITFEYETPSLEEFQERMRRVMVRYPYLVAVDDGRVVGYAYAGPFKSRAAYDWACEVTIYLDREVQGRGLGRMLYAALEEALGQMGILNLYACIGYPKVSDEYLSTNSADFHAHLGYTRAGLYRSCGYKFGRWYDMVWMEKVIGGHRDDQPPIVAYGLVSLR